MNRTRHLLLCALFALGTACRVVPNTPIPREGIHDLTVEARETLLGTEVAISGWHFHSSLLAGPRVLRTNLLEGVILIEIFPTALSKKYSNEINMTLLIPPGINRVAFGDMRSTIWKR